MKSTLPILEAVRLPDKTVEIYRDTERIKVFPRWHAERPSTSDNVIEIEKQYYRLKWKHSSS